jgi:tetratricopeptide (TPR) repeat protein
MSQFKTFFAFAGVRDHRRMILIAAFCALALGLTTPPTKAQQPQAGMASEQLLEARSKQNAGEYNAARDVLIKALSKAPNSAPLLDALGSVQQDMGDYREAERSYLRALSASTATEGDPERVVVLHNLATLYLDTGQYSKGDPLREQLEQVLPEALNHHPAWAGELLNVIATLEHVRNRDDEAERDYSRSLVLLRQAQGPASLNAALVEANIGFLRLKARQFGSAAALFREAISEIEIASGPENPALIRPLLDLANCEEMSGDPMQAEIAARRAVELSLKVYGEGHPVTATVMLERAIALRRLGRKRLAHELEKRAKAWMRNNSTKNLSGYTVGLRELAGTTNH